MPRGKQDVVVSGRPAEGGLTREEEKAAQKAMDDAPGLGITARGGTDIPITETNPDTIKQREGEAKLEKKQEALAQKNAQKAIEGAADGEVDWGGVPVKEGQNTGSWKWVKLTKGYIPRTAFCVQEGDVVRVKAATATRVLDKVQAGSKIGLPGGEAGEVVSAKIAERADEF